MSDLVEAHGRALAQAMRSEGRVLRESVRHEAIELRASLASIGIGLLCLVAACVGVLAGAALLGAAAYMWLSPQIGPPGAAASIGAAALLLGALGIWMFMKCMKN